MRRMRSSTISQTGISRTTSRFAIRLDAFSAQLKDSHIRPFVHAPHSDRVHESRGFFQSVCFKRDVPYQSGGRNLGYALLLQVSLGANDQIERRCNSPTQNEGSSSRSSTLPLASEGATCDRSNRLLGAKNELTLICPREPYRKVIRAPPMKEHLSNTGFTVSKRRSASDRTYTTLHRCRRSNFITSNSPPSPR